MTANILLKVNYALLYRNVLRKIQNEYIIENMIVLLINVICKI